MPNIDPKMSEAKLILGAIAYDLLPKLKAKGINSDSLLVWGDVLSFIYDYDKKYKKCPTIETLFLSFPEFPNFPTNNIDMDYLIDITNENTRRKKLREVLDTAIDTLEENPSKTISQILVDVSKIQLDSGVGVRYLDAHSTQRLGKYVERRELATSGIGVGIRTGISALDKEMLTWMDGDFVMIIGPPGVGKSLTLEKTCITAHKRGKKVLYVCPEMTEHNVALRFDVIAGREYGFSFSLNALRKGDEINIEEYQEWLERIENRRNWIIVDNVEGEKFTVDKLESLVDEHNPDIIGIDSLTQFTTLTGTLAVGWTDMIEITNAIKTLATKTKKIFIAIGPTVGETFGTFEPAELSEIGLSRGAAYKPDVIISMSRSRNEKMRHIKIIKMREGREITEKMDMSFDPEKGRIAD